MSFAFPHTPQPPHFTLDFDALLGRFDFLVRMADCPQDPEWHAEGNVQVHMRLVLENLVAMREWRTLPEEDRTVVFAAALLHDIAKPMQTREEGGRIRSRGHAREGAHLARRLFMTDFPEVRFAMREQIVGLVRYHGLPAYFLDRPDPVRSLLAAATSTRLDLLCILAAADARGRITKSPDDMPDRVDLFRDFAAEHNCLSQPFPFPNDHTRFVYFHNAAALPSDVLHDTTRSRVFLLAGLPASGKDTWIRQNYGDLPVISLDALRADLDIHPADDQSPIIAAAKEQARVYLRARGPFIWNATNTTRFVRDPLIAFFAAYHAHVHIVYREAPLIDLRSRNAGRAEPVPESVYQKLIDNLEPPTLTECHALTTP
jgi:putative nucleotidyltransferase with HDIG domain